MIDLPWDRLGLARFLVGDSHGVLLFADGKPQISRESATADGLPVVTYAHQGGMDQAIDLELLARTLLPTQADHGLEALCAHYAVPITATAEREAIGALLGHLLAEALSFPPDLLSILSELLPQATGGLVGRLVPLARPAEHKASSREATEVPATSVEDALGPGGAVAFGLETYEDRPGQRNMAGAIDGILAHGGTLAVEAGPGTGKTFAYLVPAILHLRSNPADRLVVSTRTKQLQEQLFQSDLPFLVSRLYPPLSVALLKGRENYACLRRWEVVLGETAHGLEKGLLTALAPFASWLFRTETGDIEENAAFFKDESAPALWARLRDHPRHCPGPLCPFVQDCFSFAARRRAREASLVVVNHSLLLADLRSGREILGDYPYLVIDEAHSFEGATRQAFTSTLAKETLEVLLAEMESPVGHRASGWLARLLLAEDDSSVQRAKASVTAVRAMNSHLFAALEAALPNEARGRTPSLDAIRPQADRLAQSMAELGLAIEEAGEAAANEECRSEGDRLVAELTVARDLLVSLFEPETENATHWFERTDGEASLHVSPVEVAPILASALYPDLEGLVLTSATLSSGDAFAYLRESVGLESSPGPLTCTVVEGPFSYDQCMRIYVPGFLPPVDGREDDYADSLSSLVSALAETTERKTLVLFTAHRLLRAVRDRLGGQRAVLAQGFDGPHSKLIEQFRAAEGGTILLGTDSFWEGIDLPGEDLEVLIITRLPFPVPTDPLLAALGERMECLGRDPFLDLALPQAILKLRQGVGRLVRRRTDRGAVILTDRRVLSRSYGGYFTRSLPVPSRGVDTLAELLSDLDEWFRPTRPEK